MVKKQKHFEIKDLTYQARWVLCVGGTLTEAITRYCKIVGIKEPWSINEDITRLGHFGGINTHRGGVLWFKDYKPGASIVGHEVFHAVFWLMDEFLEAPLCSQTEELYAYYISYLTNQITRRVW